MKTLDLYLLRRAYGTPGDVTLEEQGQLDQLGSKDLTYAVHEFLARDSRFLIANIDQSGVMLYLEARRGMFGGLSRRQQAELWKLAEDIDARYPSAGVLLNIDPEGKSATVEISAPQPAEVG